MPSDRDTPVTEAQLQEWERLCEEATPGPWESVIGDESAVIAHDERQRRVTVVGLIDDGACGDPGCCGAPSYEVVAHRSDRDLIAASRAALPALISEVRRLREIVADARPYVSALPAFYLPGDEIHELAERLLDRIRELSR